MQRAVLPQVPLVPPGHAALQRHGQRRKKLLLHPGEKSSEDLGIKQTFSFTLCFPPAAQFPAVVYPGRDTAAVLHAGFRPRIDRGVAGVIFIINILGRDSTGQDHPGLHGRHQRQVLGEPVRQSPAPGDGRVQGGKPSPLPRRVSQQQGKKKKINDRCDMCIA